jgi:carbon storage regulator
MLILTRRPMQTVRIGNDVSVTVLEIRGSQVRIGISAPRETSVLREELIDKAAVAAVGFRRPDAGS